MIRKALFLSVTVAAAVPLAASPAAARTRKPVSPRVPLADARCRRRSGRRIATVSGLRRWSRATRWTGTWCPTSMSTSTAPTTANRVTHGRRREHQPAAARHPPGLPAVRGLAGAEPRVAGVLQGVELLERVPHDLRPDHRHDRLLVLPRPEGDQGRQHDEPGAVRQHGLPAAEQLGRRERRPHGGRLGARRPQDRPRRRRRRRAARAAGRDRHLPRRRRRELPGQSGRDRRGLRPQHRLDTLHERRPHGERARRGRPGPAGLPRLVRASRSSTTPRTSGPSARSSSRS